MMSDFGPGSARATFRDLVPRVGAAATWWECVPISVAGAPPPRDADAYVGWLVDDVAASRVRIRLVVGHCAGASLAPAIADRLEAASGQGIPVVMVSYVSSVIPVIIITFRQMYGRADRR